MKAIQYLNILEPISDKLWYMREYTNPYDQYQHCVVGHIMDKLGDKAAKELEALCQKYLVEEHNIKGFITNINDRSDINGYTEDTPKARVIHLLNDMVAAGY